MSNLKHTNDTAQVGHGINLIQHREYLLRFAGQRVGNRDVAESLVQETFLGALVSHKKYDGRASERTWLTGILRNKIADHFRRVQRERALFSPLPVDTGDDEECVVIASAPAHQGTARYMETRELAAAIESALGELPQRAATVFQRSVVDGEDGAAVCKAMELSPSNYWVTLHRARKHLRSHLAEHGYGMTTRRRSRNGVPSAISGTTLRTERDSSAAAVPVPSRLATAS